MISSSFQFIGGLKMDKKILGVVLAFGLLIIVGCSGGTDTTGDIVKSGSGVSSDNGVVEVSTVLQDFKYNPDTITLKEGSTVRLTVYNKDNVGHGFNLKQFGIFGSLQPNSQKTVQFVAVKDSSTGKATFSCTQSHGETITFNII